MRRLLLLGAAAAARAAPRLVLVGETGAGKSTLGNRLLGRGAFAVGGGFDAVTAAVRCEAGRWRGRAVEVCDTPGFNDDGRRDGDTAAAILSVANGTAGLVYVHNARAARLSRSARRAMKLVVAGISSDGGAPPPVGRVAFVLTRSLGGLDGPLWRRQLPPALCAKFGACAAPPTLAFAGVGRAAVDAAALVAPRFRRAFGAWLDAVSREAPLAAAAPPADDGAAACDAQEAKWRACVAATNT